MVDPAVQTVWLIKLIPCEKQHWLSLSNCKSFSIDWGRASWVLLIALEVMNQGCLQRPTQAHIPENIRDDGLVSRLLGSVRVAFPEMLPFAHKAVMKPLCTHPPKSALLPTLRWDVCKIATRAAAAGACVSTGANNKTSSPHIRMQLVHLPNHGSLKISANGERASQCMICPRPHRKPVAKMEIEPKASSFRIEAWPWAWGHPGTLPHSVPSWRRQGGMSLTKAHIACACLSPVGWWMCLQQVLSGSRTHPGERAGDSAPWKVWQNPALRWRLLIYSFSASLSVLLMLLTRRGIFDMCWGADVEHHRARLLLRCKLSDGHKMALEGEGKEMD